MNRTLRPKQTGRKHCRRGWLVTEAVVGLTLMLVLIGVTVAGIGRYAKARDEVSWRRVALSAAEAQLVRIRAGAALDAPPPEGMLLADITLTAKATPGQGAWAGFDRVEVQATADLSPRRQYREVVTGYVPRREDAGEVEP